MDTKLILIVLAALAAAGIGVTYYLSQPKPDPSSQSRDFHKTVPIEKRQYQQ